ncbi:hypothetical protein [Marinobacter algicola]|uniref:hypothetical protein n=1 Tax=Marinobacter algicola TaxID=236100 RepID=UPI003BAD50ED
MSAKRTTEQKLIDGLDAKGAYVEGMAESLPQEFDPLEHPKGSGKREIQIVDIVWEEYFDSAEGVTGDFIVRSGSAITQEGGKNMGGSE